MGERLVFRMPYQTFLKMAAANTVAVKLDAVDFEFGEKPMQAIRDFAKRIQVAVEEKPSRLMVFPLNNFRVIRVFRAIRGSLFCSVQKAVHETHELHETNT